LFALSAFGYDARGKLILHSCTSKGSIRVENQTVPVARGSAGGAARVAALALSLGAISFLATGCHSPLYEAAARNDAEGIREMTRAGTPADTTQEVNRRTALHVAVARGNLEATHALLDAGAKPEAQDYHGNTPLMIAVSHGRTAALHAMLDKHPPLDTQDWRGATALWWACATKNEVAALMLVRAGANRDIKDTWGRSAQYFADLNGFGDALKKAAPNPPLSAPSPAPLKASNTAPLPATPSR
jgi:hypothetical protein